MKNKLIDLNNHLFAEIERLSDESITGDKLTEEVNRAMAVQKVANAIIGNAKLVLDAQIAINDGLIKKAPAMIGLEPQSKI